ncbi:MAG: NTP transferase domain-containing protein [Acidimicrobiales bacterium]|nr:NTP transferase domain-containing protein [Acidimicrobiales bacterium]
MAVGLLPAAGKATRLGLDGPKELLVHRGRPVIDHSVEHLVGAGVEALVVVSRPGKEALVQHLRATWPTVCIEVVQQHGPIGALSDALRCAAPALAGCEVQLLFPDTYLDPNPFLADSGPARHGAELELLCHDAAAEERWRHFGVVDLARRRVVEKPSEHLGSTWCWGAAWWTPAFTERLRRAATITDAINEAAWRASCPIERYEDIGLRPGLTVA